MSVTGRNDETKQFTYSAFWEILASGKPPSVDSVIDWMVVKGYGRRNRNIISEKLKECWAEAGTKIGHQRTIPGIPEETISLVVSLRDHMLDLARKEYEQSIQEVKQTAERQVADAEAKVAELTESLNRARDDLRVQENRVEHLTSELSTSNDRILTLQDDLKKATATSETLRERVVTIEAEKRSIEDQMRRMTEAHQVALKSEAERFHMLQRSLMQQVDDERTRASKLVSQLEKNEERSRQQLADFQAREREFNDARAALSAEVGQAKGLAEALQKQLTGLQQAFDLRSQELASSNELVNALRHDISQLKSEIAPLARITTDDLHRLLTRSYIDGSKHRPSVGKTAKAGPEATAATYAAAKVTAVKKAAK